MGKSLTLTLLLFALAIGSLGYIHGSVDQSKDAVTIDETVIFGDKSFARGITVDLTAHCDYRLFWDTRYTVGESSQISTSFTFSQVQRRPDQARVYSGVYLDGVFGGGYGASGILNLEDETLPVQDVASRTQPGQKHTETVFIKDYYDFYPLRVGFDRSVGFAVNQDAVNLFNDYFRIPVHQEHQVKVIIEKNAAGQVHRLQVSPVDDTEVYFLTSTTVTDSECFFTLSCYTADGELLDPSHIPGGYGIYRFPLHDRGSDDRLLTADELQTVFPLDAQRERVVALSTNRDQSRLLLVTIEEGAYILTVIDAASMTELQQLAILDTDVEMGPRRSERINLHVYDDFIVPTFNDRSLALLALDEAGNYQLRFAASFGEQEQLRYKFPRMLSMDYNGEALVVVFSQDPHSYPGNFCSFSLAVYNSAGLAYAGHYQHNLDKGPIDYRLTCGPLHLPTVTWAALSP
ncbi:MAG: hypothetical protein ACOX2K_09585 [Bacillota bacterium]